MTLTFDITHDLDLGCFKVKFRNSCISGIVGLIDVKWKWSEIIGYWAVYDFALWSHPWPWPWSFKVTVWNSRISRSGAADWHGTKSMWVIHSWPWYWLVWPWWVGRMYWIVTGVTSDVGVPLTYLVCYIHQSLGKRIILLTHHSAGKKIAWVHLKCTDVLITIEFRENFYWLLCRVKAMIKLSVLVKIMVMMILFNDAYVCQ